MLTNTVIINAIDGTRMQGLHYKTKGRTEKIIIHVHGMAGNFYENTFIESIASRANEYCIDFLSFNNRGHDYIADCERFTSDGLESFNGGGAYEVFSDCIYDIQGAIQWAVELGYTSIYLEGHSSGANKIVYAYDSICKSHKSKIKGIILISPCDDIGIFEAETDCKSRMDSFRLANEYISGLEGQKLMPLGTFFDYLLSADTFVECFGNNSPLDMFPYRKDSLEGTAISMISLPVLVIFGNNGDYVLQDFTKVESMFNDVLKTNFSFKVIDGADHSYKECEIALATCITDWIKDNRDNVG